MHNKASLAALLLAATLGASAQKPMSAPKGGKAISDELIGIFFEDISSSADGGHYAELVQNGSFEYSPNEKDGWGPATAWKVVRPGHSLGFIQPIVSAIPSNIDGTVVAPITQTQMWLHVERSREFHDFKGWKGYGLQNDGFEGMLVKAGASYDFSMRISNIGAAKQVRVALVEPQG